LTRSDTAGRGRCAVFLVNLLAVFSATVSCAAQEQQTPQGLVDAYIAAWTEFYPSRAFAYGRSASAANFEDYSSRRLAAWLALNELTEKHVRAQLNGVTPPAGRQWIDLQVLGAQARDELARWEEDRPLSRQPQWYAEQVSQALTHLLVRDQLSPQERSDALAERLAGVRSLCVFAVGHLGGGTRLRTERALATLAASRSFYEKGLPDLVADWPRSAALRQSMDAAARSIADLEEHLRTEILPSASTSAAIGLRTYDAKLNRRTGGAYGFARLLEESRREMRAVRELMRAQATRWANGLSDANRRETLLAMDGEERLASALEAMEADRQDKQADFLESFRSLTAAAERFVIDKQIATVPQPTTLYIGLSPAHFSGAAVGGVYPSGVFDPQADTLFYIPSIPDSADESAKEGFYRSFNDHFNTMILSHEMFPGHYLQYKVAVSTAPPLRSLFSNGSYVEGWGSFVEELMLDAGWAEDAPLTRLAHLRKRLENATRAYVSAAVNSEDWGREQVLRFATEEGLLAPQFASNLWQRVVNSPLQITDYFTGYRQFRELYDKARVQSDPQARRRWVDAVLRAGPLPMTLLEPEIERLRRERPENAAAL
jgi:hypothetical protein